MLGILGLGSYSTLHYIKRLNEEYHRKQGGYSTMPFKMLNVDFNNINPYLPDQFDALIPVLEESLIALNNLGISKILIPNITIHEAADKTQLSQEIKSKIIHPLDILRNNKIYEGFANVSILGTYHTMENPYILEKLGLEIKMLSDIQMKRIDDIRNELYLGHGAIEKQTEYINRLIMDNCETLFIIACTELSLLSSSLVEKNNTIDLVNHQIIRTLF